MSAKLYIWQVMYEAAGQPVQVLELRAPSEAKARQLVIGDSTRQIVSVLRLGRTRAELPSEGPLTIDQSCAYLSCSLTTFEKFLATGLLPRTPRGGLYLYDRKEHLDPLIAALRPVGRASRLSPDAKEEHAA